MQVVVNLFGCHLFVWFISAWFMMLLLIYHECISSCMRCMVWHVLPVWLVHTWCSHTIGWGLWGFCSWCFVEPTLCGWLSLLMILDDIEFLDSCKPCTPYGGLCMWLAIVCSVMLRIFCLCSLMLGTFCCTICAVEVCLRQSVLSLTFISPICAFMASLLSQHLHLVWNLLFACEPLWPY